MHDQSPYSDGIGRLYDAITGIANQGAPESFSVKIPIHGKPPQDDNRDRIWHVSAKATGCGIDRSGT